MIRKSDVIAAGRQLPHVGITWVSQWSEWRVFLRRLSGDDREASAYYTSDPEDAILTARRMNQREESRLAIATSPGFTTGDTTYDSNGKEIQP